MMHGCSLNTWKQQQNGKFEASLSYTGSSYLLMDREGGEEGGRRERERVVGTS